MSKALLFSSLVSHVTSMSIRSEKTSRDTNLGEGSCASAKLPTEEQFVSGYTKVCDTFIEGYSMHRIKHDDPLRATITLTNADGSTSEWVYRISIQNDKSSDRHDIDRTTCKNQFQEFLDGNKGLDGSQETGLGKTYCVVDGTGGDRIGTEPNRRPTANHGQGKVCMSGTGKTWISGLGSDGKAMMTFESYNRANGKPNDPSNCGTILC
ncbi:hypothetical protein HBH98_036500 [Parastagonospora nodorum]|nr:hypothetical protein HBH53_010160 [Parastagonospora nodorum]KAH3986425.1 hypothetical protein HBH52_041360 [Parastagonospora nodorum]KAH3988542.1 hypothetical protein HBH51_007660 [Parastagonospora nodorum]KAH4040103.1 hypothetical protein HBI09_023710 [Parastagonospora nodorum]KAH4056581.1 hypothetical protein HBH49_055390 [Parastagonospora nodorum]